MLPPSFTIWRLMSKVIPKGKDLFSDRGPSIVMFTKNNLTGEHVKLIREDKRTVAQIVKAYKKYDNATEQMINFIRTETKKKKYRAHYE